MVDALLSEKIKKMGVALEYKSEQGFPAFADAHAGEKLLILADRNTYQRSARYIAVAHKVIYNRFCFGDCDCKSDTLNLC